VIYLLHGWAGHYSDLGDAHDIAITRAYRIIVVMPEGNDGWYSDSATVASDKYESYILQELIPMCSGVIGRLSPLRPRIAGLSMGGYGALKLGLKSPGTFAFAGSLAARWRDDLDGRGSEGVQRD
jgi:S-formylglutathione hydrolase FrmB